MCFHFYNFLYILTCHVSVLLHYYTQHRTNPGGGGGGNLIFSYIHRLRSFFGVQIFGVFRKNNIFWVWRFCGYFWGHHKIGLYLRVISMHFRVFLTIKVQNGGCSFGLLKCQIFFSDIF